MTLSRGSRRLLIGAAGLTLAFLYVPLIVIGVDAFSTATTFEWPPPGFTTHWFGDAINNPGARAAFYNSLKAGTAATTIALVLGTLASLAVARHRFFGRETISFLVILPIALPGIVTGIALNSTFTQILGIDLSLFTIVIGHATFCIVVIYNNAVAPARAPLDLLRGGIGGPRRPHLADLPPRHPAQPAQRPGRRRPARLRPLLRRDHRHHVHRRHRHADPAALDLHQPLPPQPAADRQRGRGAGDPDLDHPGLLRPPPDPSRRRPGDGPRPWPLRRWRRGDRSYGYSVDLKRDVAVLALRLLDALRLQHAQSLDQLRAGLPWLDHVVDVAALTAE